MCGIFGYISSDTNNVDKNTIKSIIKSSESRGKDSSGLVVLNDGYEIFKIDQPIKELLSKKSITYDTNFIIGHTRLITNGSSDNQPVFSDNVVVIHNGIITNSTDLWKEINQSPSLDIDTEIVVKYIESKIRIGQELDLICKDILEKIKGTLSIAILLPEIGKFILLSNNGSLFFNNSESGTYFASERYFLEKEDLKDISQLRNDYKIFDVSIEKVTLKEDIHSRNNNLIPEFIFNSEDEKMLEYLRPDLMRCSKCILPSTMPFIEFNSDGICNYCENYKPKNNPKPKEILFKELEKYRRKNGPECLVPFSGGRDSCMGLHLIINDLDMKPITYTYDWGMVTDLGRRNISRMCSQLNIENIIVAADIHKKRENIKKNIIAWLENPHLGMVNLFTAGDKHFFRYVEQKLWFVNYIRSVVSNINSERI